MGLFRKRAFEHCNKPDGDGRYCARPKGHEEEKGDTGHSYETGQDQKRESAVKQDPEYAKHYHRGWRHSAGPNASLETGDRNNEPTAWYHGYQDNAAGRDKWASAPGGWNHPDTPKEAMAREAVLHIAVDQSGTIRRCPFCGSGQVLQRSDGTTHCDFCDTSFTVTMMPNMPAMPTFVDGQDMANDNNMGPEEIPAEGMDPMDPTAMGMDPMADPAAGGDFMPPEGTEGGDPAAGGGVFVPPEGTQAMATLRTATGALLDEDAYARHLALLVAGDQREAVLEVVRAEHLADDG